MREKPAIPVKVKKERGPSYFKSALVFAFSYIVLLVVVLLMIVINNPEGWQTFTMEHYLRLLSLCVSTLLLYGIVFYYYYYEDKEALRSPKTVLLIFSICILTVVFYYVFGKFANIYARPYALLALLMLFLFNRRQAVMLNFVFSLLMFVIDVYTSNFGETVTDQIYFSLLLSFSSGTIAIFLASNVKTRGGLILTGIFIAIPTMIVVLLLELPVIIEPHDWIAVVVAVGFGILGCILSAVLALALLPVFEHTFNRLTVFRLRELTSTNAPLLRRLQEDAPGTFNHSLIVAQLSETCAIAVGENAELARAAAYYHDVGKLKQPDCFTENQTDYNLHNELTPELSADIIRSHTKDGYDLLVASRLPMEIADVAREHHGTLPIKYFYDKAMRLSGGDVDIADYSYLGPTPRSKIAAIVMIADASEAAVRSLKDRTPENVERVVRGIIEERMDLDQFEDCSITLKELTIIKQTVVDALSGVHHHRVKYPAIRFNRDRQAVKEEEDEE